LSTEDFGLLGLDPEEIEAHVQSGSIQNLDIFLMLGIEDLW